MQENVSIKVLYAEDSEQIRVGLNRILSKRFEVYCAKDGVEAYAMFKQFNPDVVITDIKMPNIDGVELIKKIREHNKQVTIILTTAYTDEKYLLGLIDKNVYQYMIKPIKVKELIDVVTESQLLKTQNEGELIKLTDTLFFDINNKDLIYNGVKEKLSYKEKKLVEILAKHKTSIVSYDEIENYVWEGEDMSKNSLKTIVKNIRKKIPVDFIETYSKTGYKII